MNDSDSGTFDIVGLSKYLENTIPTISESDFVHFVIPAIVGSVNGETDLYIWQHYARSMTRPLDVIDASGRVLFRAPAPISNAVSVVTPDIDGRTMREIVREALARQNAHPVMGDTFLMEETSDHIGDHLLDGSPDEAIRTWRSILARYGYIKQESVSKLTLQQPMQAEQSIFSDEDEPLD